MNQEVFIEAIRVSGQAAAAALSNAESLSATTPDRAAALGAAAFTGVFNQIVTAVQAGHLDEDEDEELDGV
jgi:hypothetical protein